MTKLDPADQPEPLKVSRIFAAPRERVFQAWSAAEHVSRWFCPNGYSIPEADVRMELGGPFEICMQAPDGTRHWTRGTFVELVPPQRLALDLRVTDAAGMHLFDALTEVDFVAVGDSTRMEVTQRYTITDPAMVAPMMKGAPVGWAQTLDKLDAEIDRIATENIRRAVVHDTFRIERRIAAASDRVFTAFSDLSAKRKWFGGDAGRWEELEAGFDFRAGGRETLEGRWASGTVTRFDALYHDIEPGRRIVYSYDMHVGGEKISISLATVEFEPIDGGATLLRITEQGAFLNGYHDGGSRERGTAWLIDRLAASLAN